MADTLSQEEVDALREAIKSGEDLGDAEVAPQDDTDQVRVTSYNFRKPHLVSAEQMRAIEMLHESMAKGIQVALSSRLKTTVEAKLVAIDQISYSEFVLSLSNPTCLSVLRTDPDIGQLGMEVSLSVAMVTLQTLLGGSGGAAAEARELTVLEADLFKGILEMILAQLGREWSTMAPVTFTLDRNESNPEFLQMMTPESSCLSVTLDVHVNETSGVFNFCYPFSMVQAVLKKAESRLAAGRGQSKDRDRTLKAVGAVPLEVRAVVGEGVVSAEQLGSLKLGDVLCLDRRCDSAVDVYIGEQAAFRAKLGQQRGRAAVCLLGSLPAEGSGS